MTTRTRSILSAALLALTAVATTASGRLARLASSCGSFQAIADACVNRRA